MVGALARKTKPKWASRQSPMRSTKVNGVHLLPGFPRVANAFPCAPLRFAYASHTLRSVSARPPLALRSPPSGPARPFVFALASALPTRPDPTWDDCVRPPPPRQTASTCFRGSRVLLTPSLAHRSAPHTLRAPSARPTLRRFRLSLPPSDPTLSPRLLGKRRPLASQFPVHS